MTLVDWHKAGSEFHYRGHPIFYASEGQGDPLLLIHGFPTASWDWHRIWPKLTDRFRVVAPDMIGFGFSGKPYDYNYSLLDQASLHEELLDLLAVRRTHILAHDYGDSVAQELLSRAEERREKGEAGLEILSCCFLNGGLFPEVHRPRRVQTLLAGRLGPVLSRLMNERSFRRGFSAIFGPGTKPSPEELHEFWQLIRHNQGTRIAHKLIGYMEERRQHRDRWVHTMQTTKIPLFTINGPLDPVSGAHMLTRYRSLIPNAQFASLPEIGHYPQVEDPRGTLLEYLRFVERHL